MNSFVPIIESKFIKHLQILRTILSYLVLQFHCYDISLTKNKIIIGSINAIKFYVPSFYVISFFFSYKTFIFRNITKIKMRLERFIIPYLTYSILFSILNHIIHYNNYILTFRNLASQLISGMGICNSFWYLCNLIFIFIFFSIIILIFKENTLFIIQLIGIFGYLFNYYIYYNDLFCSYEEIIRLLFHNITRVLFYGSLGISLASIIDLNLLQKNRKKSIFFALFIIYLIRDYNLIYKEFYYLKEIIIGITALSLFILFFVFPFDNINQNNKKIIISLTNYSGGIYYLHIQLWRLLQIKFIMMKNKELLGCLINYLICYFICFIGTKLFRNSKFKYLFN